MQEPKLMGHRGCRGEEPENTLRGIKKAIKVGVDAIEIDIHKTKDNQIVVCHDDSIDRTTNGKGKILDLNYNEIKKYRTKKQQKIPLLQEIIDIIRITKVELFIEIKCPNIEDLLIKIIKKNKIAKQIVIKSFNHRILKTIKEKYPVLKTACLFVGLPVKPWLIPKEAKADMISVLMKLVDKKLINDMQSRNYKICIWNANTKDELNHLKVLNPDYICTDYPSKMVKLMKK